MDQAKTNDSLAAACERMSDAVTKAMQFTGSDVSLDQKDSKGMLANLVHKLVHPIGGFSMIVQARGLENDASLENAQRVARSVQIKQASQADTLLPDLLRDYSEKLAPDDIRSLMKDAEIVALDDGASEVLSAFYVSGAEASKAVADSYPETARAMNEMQRKFTSMHDAMINDRAL